MAVLPLVIALPLAAAALLVILTDVAGPRVGNSIAVAAAAATTGLCAYVLSVVGGAGTQLYWFGSWKPETHAGIGIDLTVDGLGAGGALLAAFVVTLVLFYSIRYYKDSGPLFNVLILVFLGAACACFYTGDLFDLFVFFELSNIALFALSAYRVRDAAALDGALLFVVTNSIAAFVTLFGLTLLESHTDQLNLATIGQYLAVHPVQAVAVTALALAAAGFFIRAGVLPFQFWFPDAQTSAPSPVGALLAGVSVEIGLYAFARVYWTAFSGVMHDTAVLSAGLMSLGAASALYGSLVAFGAHHLKRVIAYVTVAHIGVVLMAIGLLNAAGIAAAALYGGAFSLADASLLLCAGMVIHRFNSADELKIWGQGREIPATMAIFTLAALAASGLAVFGTFYGRSLLMASAPAEARVWIGVVTLLTAVLTGGALLKASGAIWLGLGEPDRELESDGTSGSKEQDENDQPEEHHVGWHLLLPAMTLCAAAFVAPAFPGVWRGAQQAAALFVDRGHYYAMVVYGHAPPVAAHPRGLDFTASAVLGVVALAGAVLLALGALYERRFPLLHASAKALSHPMALLERLHSGRVGDYVTFLVFGCAVLGALMFFAYR